VTPSSRQIRASRSMRSGDEWFIFSRHRQRVTQKGSDVSLSPAPMGTTVLAKSAPTVCYSASAVNASARTVSTRDSSTRHSQGSYLQHRLPPFLATLPRASVPPCPRCSASAWGAEDARLVARGGSQFFTISSRSCYRTFMPGLAPFVILSSVMGKGGAGALRTLLGVAKSFAETSLGMLRYGLMQRGGRGRYVATEPSRHDLSERREPGGGCSHDSKPCLDVSSF